VAGEHNHPHFVERTVHKTVQRLLLHTLRLLSPAVTRGSKWKERRAVRISKVIRIMHLHRAVVVFRRSSDRKVAVFAVQGRAVVVSYVFPLARLSWHESDAIFSVTVIKTPGRYRLAICLSGRFESRRQIDIDKWIAIAGAGQFDFKNAPLLD